MYINQVKNKLNDIFFKYYVTGIEAGMKIKETSLIGD